MTSRTNHLSAVLLAGVVLAACVALNGQGDDPTTTTAPTVPDTQPATQSTTEPATQNVRQVKLGEMTFEGWFTPTQRPAAAPDLSKSMKNAYIIPIREDIGIKTFRAIRRKATRALEAGADIIIFDMDTWGGRVDAAMDISRFIKVDLADVPTVCYVRTRAVSAGALIALACDEIIITSVGTLGDSAPISMGGELQGIQREKIETVLRNEFRESARRNGYSAALAQSMVSRDLEVWLIRNKQTQQLQFVLAEEWSNQVTTPDQKNPGAQWELLQVAVTDKRLLTLDAPLAKDYGFAAAVVSPSVDEPYAPLIERYGMGSQPTLLEDTWSESLVEVLTSPAVSGILVFVGLLCAYAEIQSPGFGVAGTVAIICFATLFGANYLVGMAAWWEIAIFFIGVLLLAIELFVIPGFGVAGVLGIIMMIIGILAMLVPNAPDRLPIPTNPVDWGVFSDSLFAFCVAVVSAIVVGFALSKYLPSVPFARRLMLEPVIVAGDTTYAEESPISHVKPGDVGVVVAVCRPIGKVRFGDDLVDAYSQGEIIDAGARVRVLRRDGNQIIVERA